MKALILAFIAGIAGFIAYLALSPGCQGVEVMSRQTCARLGPAESACHSLFDALPSEGAKSGPVFTDRIQCEASYRTCVQTQGAAGFSPVPAGLCVVVEGGRIARWSAIRGGR